MEASNKLYAQTFSTFSNTLTTLSQTTKRGFVLIDQLLHGPNQHYPANAAPSLNHHYPTHGSTPPNQSYPVHTSLHAQNSSTQETLPSTTPTDTPCVHHWQQVGQECSNSILPQQVVRKQTDFHTCCMTVTESSSFRLVLSA